MLIEFSCSNFRSIKNEVLFSMRAGMDDTYADTLIGFDKFNILRTAVIYGANGSGKSNFIKALQFVRDFVVKSISFQPGEPLKFQPHKMASENDTVFRLQFIKDGLRFEYGFAHNRNVVTSEHLYVYPLGRQQKIFERTSDAFIAGD